jgi:hypothetical protein
MEESAQGEQIVAAAERWSALSTESKVDWERSGLALLLQFDRSICTFSSAGCTLR